MSAYGCHCNLLSRISSFITEKKFPSKIQEIFYEPHIYNKWRVSDSSDCDWYSGPETKQKNIWMRDQVCSLNTYFCINSFNLYIYYVFCNAGCGEYTNWRNKSVSYIVFCIYSLSHILGACPPLYFDPKVCSAFYCEILQYKLCLKGKCWLAC